MPIEHLGMCVDLCVWTRVCTRVLTDVRTRVEGTCIDTCMVACIGICMAVLRHVYGHMYGHVYRHVYRHAYRHGIDTCAEMWLEMCTGMLIPHAGGRGSCSNATPRDWQTEVTDLKKLRMCECVKGGVMSNM